jgi:hypothetical protein
MGPTRNPDNGAGMTVTILTIAGSFGHRSSWCAQTTMGPIMYTNYAKCVPIPTVHRTISLRLLIELASGIKPSGVL